MKSNYAAVRSTRDAADIEQMEREEKAESAKTRKDAIVRCFFYFIMVFLFQEIITTIFLGAVFPILNAGNCIAQFIIDWTTGLGVSGEHVLFTISCFWNVLVSELSIVWKRGTGEEGGRIGRSLGSILPARPRGDTVKTSE